MEEQGIGFGSVTEKDQLGYYQHDSKLGIPESNAAKQPVKGVVLARQMFQQLNVPSKKSDGRQPSRGKVSVVIHSMNEVFPPYPTKRLANELARELAAGT